MSDTCSCCKGDGATEHCDGCGQPVCKHCLMQVETWKGAKANYCRYCALDENWIDTIDQIFCEIDDDIKYGRHETVVRKLQGVCEALKEQYEDRWGP